MYLGITTKTSANTTAPRLVLTCTLNLSTTVGDKVRIATASAAIGQVPEFNLETDSQHT